MTRVLFVNHSAEMGGGELAMLDLVCRTPDARVALFSNGPLVEALQSRGVPVDIVEGGSVLSVRRSSSALKAAAKGPKLAALAWRLARLARGTDCLYANSQKAMMACSLARLGSASPLIWHLHDILDNAHFSGAIRRVAITLANRSAALVIANSRATAAAFREAGGTVGTTVIHNGIDPSPFADSDRTKLRADLAEQLGCGPAPLLGMFGRLAEWKGQHVAIAAMTRLPAHHLVVVGGALFSETSYEAGLRALAKELQVADRVHFLGFRSDVASLMGGVDVALHCSIAPEPFGRVIVEAMMAGTPVIATEAGGAVEIIEDARVGLLIPPGDPAALADAVRALLSTTAHAAHVGLAGRRHALTTFGLPASIVKIHDAIDSAVPRRGNGGTFNAKRAL